MTEKLGDVIPASETKSEKTFKAPERRAPLTFTPLANTSSKGGQDSVQFSTTSSRFSRTSSKSVASDLRRRVLSNGGFVQKPQYR